MPTKFAIDHGKVVPPSKVKPCSCGAVCWVAEDPDLAQELGPCGGKIHVTEWPPGCWGHYCDNHDTGD